LSWKQILILFIFMMGPTFGYSRAIVKKNNSIGCRLKKSKENYQNGQLFLSRF